MPRIHRRINFTGQLIAEEENAHHDHEDCDSREDECNICTTDYDEDLEIMDVNQENDESQNDDEAISHLSGADLDKASAMIEAGLTLRGAERILAAFDANNTVLKNYMKQLLGSDMSRKRCICNECGTFSNNEICSSCNKTCLNSICAYYYVLPFLYIFFQYSVNMEDDYEPQYEQVLRGPAQMAANPNAIDVSRFYFTLLLDRDGSPRIPSEEELLRHVSENDFVDDSFIEVHSKPEDMKMFFRVSNQVYRAHSVLNRNKWTNLQQAVVEESGNESKSSQPQRRNKLFESNYEPLSGLIFNLERSLCLRLVADCPLTNRQFALFPGPGGSLTPFSLYGNQTLTGVCSQFAKKLSSQLWTDEQQLMLTGSEVSLKAKYRPLSHAFIHAVKALFLTSWKLQLTQLKDQELTSKLRGGFCSIFDNCRNKTERSKKMQRFQQLENQAMMSQASSQDSTLQVTLNQQKNNNSDGFGGTC